MNFWKQLKKPTFILAPMDGVTDTVFRQLISSIGKPDVFFTEFVPVDALLSKGKEKAIKTLTYLESERPVVAQIWGSDPDKFYQVAKLLSQMKFDGIDINMGCPDKNAIKKGACSALIQNPKLAQEIILATIKGANCLPVSVKTRIGFHNIDTENWIRNILQTPISALTVHLRTVSEMSKPSAHWEEISKVVKIRDKINPEALIIGNGDIKSIPEAKEKCQKYGIDGVMIGRGIFENLWVFNPKINPENITPQEKISLLLKHLELFSQTWKNTRNFETIKKFVKCYVRDFPGAVETREKLMKTKTLSELIQATKEIPKEFLLG